MFAGDREHCAVSADPVQAPGLLLPSPDGGREPLREPGCLFQDPSSRETPAVPQQTGGFIYYTYCTYLNDSFVIKYIKKIAMLRKYKLHHHINDSMAEMKDKPYVINSTPLKKSVFNYHYTISKNPSP